MAYNLFIAYDLIPPGQNYEEVRERIRELGRWHQFQYSLFYVHTPLTPQEAYTHVAQAMDWRDRLAVIDAYRASITRERGNPPEELVNAVWFGP